MGKTLEKEAILRVKLLIATFDNEYAGHLSDSISEHHADAIEVSVCGTPDRLRELLTVRKFDAALLEAPFIEGTDLSSIHLPILLWAEDEDAAKVPGEIKRLRKYQRISTVVASVLEHYAKVTPDGHGSDSAKAQITAVWSPAGGVGKTTVALACAARKASDGKQALYLNLESFSSIPTYFAEAGKSISAVFELLENRVGNVQTLIRAIRRQDNGAGIAYFCKPDNFDDMNILSAENVSALVSACAGVTEELVIDMSCVCDERTRRVFELADRILIVTDTSGVAQFKLSQFTTQHNVFARIKSKMALVANKGANVGESQIDVVIRLPHVQSTNASVVYKTLSGCLEL